MTETGRKTRSPARAAALVALTALAGCSLVPDFNRPAATTTAAAWKGESNAAAKAAP